MPHSIAMSTRCTTADGQLAVSFLPLLSRKVIVGCAFHFFEKGIFATTTKLHIAKSSRSVKRRLGYFQRFVCFDLLLHGLSFPRDDQLV